MKDEPVHAFASADAWLVWLRANHTRSTGVWLRMAKGAAPGLRYPAALDAALAWGWIDSQKSALDATAWLQRFSPRSPKGPWSQINCAKAEALIAAGAMEAPGLREVERAKADGRWARAYAGARTATMPDDLAAALAGVPGARAFFDALSGANRYAILYRVHSAVRAETRARRIEQLTAMCARGETLYPQKAVAAKAKAATPAKAARAKSAKPAAAKPAKTAAAKGPRARPAPPKPARPAPAKPARKR